MLTVLALAFLVLASLFALSLPQHDFIEYWTASHLLLMGGNPYLLTEMFAAEGAQLEQPGYFDFRVPHGNLSSLFRLAFSVQRRSSTSRKICSAQLASTG